MASEEVGPGSGRFGREERRGVEEIAGTKWVRPRRAGEGRASAQQDARINMTIEAKNARQWRRGGGMKWDRASWEGQRAETQLQWT